jgi:hypothetical protein
LESYSRNSGSKRINTGADNRAELVIETMKLFGE